ncbi:hypothetical protein EMIT0194MI4_100203 [Pseudomonas sp. IT-194MI4]
MFLYGPSCSRGGPIEPFDDGSNKPLQNVAIPRRSAQTRLLRGLAGAGEACDLLIFAEIVTKSAKSVYQKHSYMPATPKPKIGLANTAM